MRCERPLLLAIVEGVAAAALPPLDGAATPPLPLRLPSPADLVLAIAELRPAAMLRDLGIAVEQRCLCLRPPWRSDEAALQLMAQRRCGPAAVTVLQLREPLLQAVAHGAGSRAFADAVARLPQRLATAAELLRQGGLPELWLVATGATVPVHETFDLAAALRRRLPWPFARGLAIELLPELARIHSGSERGRQRLSAMLQAEPFCRHGTLVDAGSSDVIGFAAADGVAFGRRPLRARRALAPAAAALLPMPLRTATTLDPAGLVGRFCLRAIELSRAGEPAPRPQPAPTMPDVAAVLAAAPPS